MKRGMDLIISILAILLCLPVFIIISLLVYLKLGAPIFFVQERIGKNGKSFKMIKFRSMINTNNKENGNISDKDRLTDFGKILRSSSLDELPELFNVVKGDMSLVGPRPLLVEYLPIYSETQMKRHDARPGITGWAQVNGRNSISWTKRLELDVWYIENRTMILDLKIIFMTFINVFRRVGITQDGNATMDKFNGFN